MVASAAFAVSSIRPMNTRGSDVRRRSDAPVREQAAPSVSLSLLGRDTNMRFRRTPRASLGTVLLPLLMLSFTLMPRGSWAQGTGGIAGVVKDTTGGVLPGVTVEASSPVLIEKVRTVTTDTAGQYKIIDLLPGTYTVTFTMPGFSTLKQEKIDLTSNFTATVNADMRVGSLEES